MRLLRRAANYIVIHIDIDFFCEVAFLLSEIFGGFIMSQIVIIGHFRYKNGKIMGVGHNWAEDNADLKWVKGLTKVDTFHVAPDKGMGVYYFKSMEQAKEALSGLEEFFSGYSDMFDCRIVFELGAFNETLSEKLTSQARG